MLNPMDVIYAAWLIALTYYALVKDDGRYR